MKINEIQRMIFKVQKNLICPNCSHKLLAEEAEVVSVRRNSMKFFVICNLCKTQINIEGEIHLRRQMSKSMKQGSTKLSLAQVQLISKKLRSFRGKNVKELFEE